MRTFGYEAAAEIYKTKKFTQFGKRGRKGEITNDLDFGIKGLDALRSDFMTEELDGGNPETDFAGLMIIPYCRRRSNSKRRRISCSTAFVLATRISSM